jgi:hypothetical protein
VRATLPASDETPVGRRPYLPMGVEMQRLEGERDLCVHILLARPGVEDQSLCRDRQR